MLTSKQKAKLKSLANTKQPSVTLGKGEIDNGVIESINNSLKAHELIKIKVLNNSAYTSKELSEELAKLTNSEVVSVIGHIITLYKRNNKKPRIEL